MIVTANPPLTDTLSLTPAFAARGIIRRRG